MIYLLCDALLVLQVIRFETLCPPHQMMCLFGNTCECQVHRSTKICGLLAEEHPDGSPLEEGGRAVDSNSNRLISATFTRKQQKMIIPRGESGGEDWLERSVVEVMTLKQSVLVVVPFTYQW